jgi:BMFP domain-containing protein YqiC
MDLSIVVFDLRDAIEELREERAALLKRIEALEAQLAQRGGTR